MLDQARRRPDAFVIGIDPVASAMGGASRRAAAKPSRGGLDNAMFMRASLETLPPLFDGVANAITVNYPWGPLLRAVALPDVALLAKLAAVAAPAATLDVTINMHPLRDAAYAAKLGLTDATLVRDPAKFRAAYQSAGFTIRSIEDITSTLPHATRWGSQLHHAGREIWRIRARHL